MYWGETTFKVNPYAIADVDELLVDEQRSMSIIEDALSADEVVYLVEPSGMVNQLFKRPSGLVNFPVIQAVMVTVGVAVYVIIPLTYIQKRKANKALVTGLYPRAR